MTWRPLLDELRRQLLTVSGIAPALLLAACGGAAVEDPDTAGVTTDPSGDGSTVDEGSDDPTPGTSTGTDPNPSTSSEGPDPDPDPDPEDTETSDDEGEDPPKFDLPPQPDLPPLGDCTVTTTPTSSLDEHPDCPIIIDDPTCWGLYWGCVDLQDGQTCESQCPEGNCVFDWSNCAGDSPYEVPEETCGPYEVDGQCCSFAKVFEYCGTDGRPFVVAGTAREAGLIERGNASTRDRDLPEHVRVRLAAHWAAIARAEHASVASFAQFGARLLALGAPANMVREALGAAADEVRHAELALTLASELEGRRLEFGPLDTRQSNAHASFADTVLACVREGCIGETLAAVELRAAALVCHPNLAATLNQIADDELRHAALAWRFVRWALDRAPSLAPEIAAQFDDLVLADLDDESFTASEHELLCANGCLLGERLAEVRRDAVRELLAPCVAALLGSSRAAMLCRQS